MVRHPVVITTGSPVALSREAKRIVIAGSTWILLSPTATTRQEVPWRFSFSAALLSQAVNMVMASAKKQREASLTIFESTRSPFVRVTSFSALEQDLRMAEWSLGRYSTPQGDPWRSSAVQ
jgi:hypothetical protein